MILNSLSPPYPQALRLTVSLSFFDGPENNGLILSTFNLNKFYL